MGEGGENGGRRRLSLIEFAKVISESGKVAG